MAVGQKHHIFSFCFSERKKNPLVERYYHIFGLSSKIIVTKIIVNFANYNINYVINLMMRLTSIKVKLEDISL